MAPGDTITVQLSDLTANSLAATKYVVADAVQLRPGNDVAVIACGCMVELAVRAAEALGQEGIGARVLNMHTIKPLDREAVVRAAAETRFVFTLEEHSIEGGLGGAVAEVLAELEPGHAPLKRIGLRPEFNKVVGDQAYLKTLHGLDDDGVMRTIQPIIDRSYGLVR